MSTPNTLTDLIPDFFYAMNVVSREQVGLIPSISLDATTERAAKDQIIRTHVVPTASTYDVTPGQLPVDNGQQTIGNTTMAISKVKYAPMLITGEEELGLDSPGGPGSNSILQDQIQEGIRALVNEMEADAAALFYKASRAVAPAGTTLFDAANYKDVANVAKILDDNGAPASGRALVLNTLATAAFRGNAQNTGANTAGSDSFQRNGIMLPMFGMDLRTSGQIKSQTAGTASGLKTDSTGYAVGATTITVATDGSGTILPGDVVSFSTDATGSKYVVLSGGDMGSGGTLVINAPGLRGSLAASQADITVNTSTDKNMAFSRNAIHMVTRAPAVPKRGDMARDRITLRDPYSGIAFTFTMWPGYYMNKFEVAAAWGVEVIKKEHLALLID
jgi:hypothetical protein